MEAHGYVTRSFHVVQINYIIISLLLNILSSLNFYHLQKYFITITITNK